MIAISHFGNGDSFHESHLCDFRNESTHLRQTSRHRIDDGCSANGVCKQRMEIPPMKRLGILLPMLTLWVGINSDVHAQYYYPNRSYYPPTYYRQAAPQSYYRQPAAPTRNAWYQRSTQHRTGLHGAPGAHVSARPMSQPIYNHTTQRAPVYSYATTSQPQMVRQPTQYVVTTPQPVVQEVLPNAVISTPTTTSVSKYPTQVMPIGPITTEVSTDPLPEIPMTPEMLVQDNGQGGTQNGQPTIPAPTELPNETPVVEEVIIPGGTFVPAPPTSKFWGAAEYLLYWFSEMNLPPLVTTGGQASGFGRLGDPQTQILFGGDSLDFGEQHGGRFTLGMWFDRQQTWGVEGVFFFFDADTENFFAYSPNDPLLARPFFNGINGQPLVQQVANLPPVELAGSVAVNTEIRFNGGELNLYRNHANAPGFRWDWLFGVRYLHLSDGVSIEENLVAPLNDPVNPGTMFLVRDNFETWNDIFAGQIGGKIVYQYGIFDATFMAKVGIGQNMQKVGRSGLTSTTNPGESPVFASGGLLTQASNIGTFDRDRFVVVPELNFTVGVQVTDFMRVAVGYNFIYINDVVRSGDQIDLRVNPNLIPLQNPQPPLDGPFLPSSDVNSTDFWAHGVNFSIWFRY